jgi:hypothetical protein
MVQQHKKNLRHVTGSGESYMAAVNRKRSMNHIVYPMLLI